MQLVWRTREEKERIKKTSMKSNYGGVANSPYSRAELDSQRKSSWPGSVSADPRDVFLSQRLPPLCSRFWGVPEGRLGQATVRPDCRHQLRRSHVTKNNRDAWRAEIWARRSVNK